MNHTRFPREDHLTDWQRRDNKVMKGDRAEAEVTMWVVWFKLPDCCHQGHGRDLLNYAPCCVDFHTRSCSQTRCLLPSGCPAHQCLSPPSVTHDFHLAINTFETPCKKLTNEKSTWCHLLFYFTYYALNMFRTLIYPPSGAWDCVDELPHRSSCSQFVVCCSFCCGWYLVVFVCRLKHCFIPKINLRN